MLAKMQYIGAIMNIHTPLEALDLSESYIIKFKDEPGLTTKIKGNEKSVSGSILIFNEMEKIKRCCTSLGFVDFDIEFVPSEGKDFRKPISIDEIGGCKFDKILLLSPIMGICAIVLLTVAGNWIIAWSVAFMIYANNLDRDLGKRGEHDDS